MARYKNYFDFLKSDRWAELRFQAFDRDKWKCKSCGAGAKVVHHLVYTRWGEEDLSNLVSMCKGCHEELHEARRKTAEITGHDHKLPLENGAAMEVSTDGYDVSALITDRDGVVFQFYASAEDYHNHCADFLREDGF
jgi:hypothetical protein